jgi:TonB family protein
LQPVLAQETWHGRLSGDTKWSGEVIVDGDIIIPDGVSLNIEPGTKIYVLPNTDVTKGGKDKNRAEIFVFGSFIANGEPNNRILFTSKNENPQMNDWYGIIFKSKHGTNLVNYVTVEYAYVGLTIINCKAIIKNSQFRFNYYTGISAELRSKPIIQNCVISNNDYAGLKCEYGAAPIVKYCIISGNSHGVIIFNEAEPMLGKIESNGEVTAGYNRIFDNFDYNIYNHTYKSIYAQVNNWLTDSPEEIQKTIYDKSKDPQYGPVVFEPDQTTFEKKRVVARQTRRKPNVQKNATTANKSVSQPEAPTVKGNNENIVANKVTKQEESVTQQPVAKNTQQVSKTAKTTKQKTAPEKPNEVVLAANQKNTQPPKETTPAVENTPEPKKEEPAPKTEVFQEDPNEIYWSGKKTVFEYMLDSKPKRLKIVKPKYPTGVGRLTKAVRVWLNLTIDMKGNVESVRILKVDGRQEYAKAAIEAVKQFKYTQGTLHGKPVRYTKTERIDFLP